MIETAGKPTSEIFPHISLFCSELFSQQDLKVLSFNLIPIGIDSIPSDEGTVYFYHQNEESKIKEMEENIPNCYFSPLAEEGHMDFLTAANELAQNKKILKQLQYNLEELGRNEKKLSHLLKRESLGETDQSLIDQYYDSDAGIFNAVDTDELIQGIKKSFGKKIKNLALTQMLDLEETSTDHFPIFVGKNIYVLHLEFKKIDEYEEVFLKSMIYYWVSRFMSLTRECEQDSGGNTLWEKIFSTIPLPLALISENGEILLHNKQFVDLHLLPSQCLNMKSGEKVQLKDMSYFLDRFDLNNKVLEREEQASLYFFRAISEDGDSGETSLMQKISSKELGIISSSIAHELNNPLGGVMAAISLLELDSWSDENRQHLADMKESAKRCRDLIEIFLGFSKVSKNASKTCCLEEAIKQSLNMLRFRMIESNLRFELSYEIEDKFGVDVNFSTSTMLFYLIFGEVLTAVHHEMLISANKNKIIKGSYQENRDCASIIFENPISYQKDLMESKLLRYLIDTENLNVEIKDNKIIISEWKLT